MPGPHLLCLEARSDDAALAACWQALVPHAQGVPQCVDRGGVRLLGLPRGASLQRVALVVSREADALGPLASLTLIGHGTPGAFAPTLGHVLSAVRRPGAVARWFVRWPGARAVAAALAPGAPVHLVGCYVGGADPDDAGEREPGLLLALLAAYLGHPVTGTVAGLLPAALRLVPGAGDFERVLARPGQPRLQAARVSNGNDASPRARASATSVET